MGTAASAAGRKLGRYQLVKHLASGGMAEVLLARVAGIEGFQRHVVIKRIRPGQAHDREFVQMFLNEARLAAQLHHANIVQVHDIGQEGDEYFFAMEYVHGEDLRRLLQELARQKAKLPLAHVITIVSAAAVALHHAHEQRGPDRKPLGIVHRDVTPANILVGYDGNVKVVDFGIAKAIARTTIETQAGTLKGKASYMSPEQCGGAEVDRRSDVFALGIVLYELVTTRRLFKAANDFLTMSSIVSGKVPPPRTHRPDLPSSLEAIILKALALRPEDRFQSADDMREALEDFASMQGLRTSTSQLASYMKQMFGEKPEPWLVEDDDDELELTIDFDGSASGLAPAPEAAVEAMAVPERFDRRSSPIMKARTRAASELPIDVDAPIVAAKPAATDAAIEGAAKRPLPGVAPVTKAKPITRQIPLMPTPTAADKAKAVRKPDVAPAPVAAPPRRRPITVQIPVATQAAGIQPTKTETASAGLPGVAPAASAVPTVVDVDDGWGEASPPNIVGDVPVPPAQVARGSEQPIGARNAAQSGAAKSEAVAVSTKPAKPVRNDATPVPGVASTKPARTDATPTPVVASTRPVRNDATPIPVVASKTPSSTDSTPAVVTSTKPTRTDATPIPVVPSTMPYTNPAAAAPTKPARTDATPIPAFAATKPSSADSTPVPGAIPGVPSTEPSSTDGTPVAAVVASTTTGSAGAKATHAVPPPPPKQKPVAPIAIAAKKGVKTDPTPIPTASRSSLAKPRPASEPSIAAAGGAPRGIAEPREMRGASEPGVPVPGIVSRAASEPGLPVASRAASEPGLPLAAPGVPTTRAASEPSGPLASGTNISRPEAGVPATLSPKTAEASGPIASVDGAIEREAPPDDSLSIPSAVPLATKPAGSAGIRRERAFVPGRTTPALGSKTGQAHLSIPNNLAIGAEESAPMPIEDETVTMLPDSRARDALEALARANADAIDDDLEIPRAVLPSPSAPLPNPIDDDDPNEPVTTVSPDAAPREQSFPTPPPPAMPGAVLVPRGTARSLTPPKGAVRPSTPPHGSRPGTAEGSRPSTPAHGSRPGTAGDGLRTSSLAHGSRPSTPAHGTRPSTAEGSRRSTPAHGSRPSTAGDGSRRSTPAHGASAQAPRTALPDDLSIDLDALSARVGATAEPTSVLADPSGTDGVSTEVPASGFELHSAITQILPEPTYPADGPRTTVDAPAYVATGSASDAGVATAGAYPAPSYPVVHHAALDGNPLAFADAQAEAATNVVGPHARESAPALPPPPAAPPTAPVPYPSAYPQGARPGFPTSSHANDWPGVGSLRSPGLFSQLSPTKIAIAVALVAAIVVALVMALGGDDKKKPAASEPAAAPPQRMRVIAPEDHGAVDGVDTTGSKPDRANPASTIEPAPITQPETTVPHAVTKPATSTRPPVTTKPETTKPAAIAKPAPTTKPAPIAKPAKPATKPATVTKPATPKPATKPTTKPKPTWDPDSLFLKKK